MTTEDALSNEATRLRNNLLDQEKAAEFMLLSMAAIVEDRDRLKHRVRELESVIRDQIAALDKLIADPRDPIETQSEFLFRRTKPRK